MTETTVTMGRNALEVRFAFDPSLVKAIREVPGSEWHKSREVWRVPLDIEVAEEFGRRMREAGAAIRMDERVAEWGRDARVLRETLTRARAVEDRELLYERAADLYRFQRVAVGFLADRGHGLLGDEMGLGKTPMAIAAIRELELRHDRGGPHLVVCPNSKRLDWEAEIGEWYPEAVDVHQVGNRVADADGFHVVNWERMIRRPQLLRVPWTAVVGDESHRMKNKSTKSSVQMRKLTGEHRFLLSGTPVKNNVMDLWAQLNFVEPERWPSYWRFFDRYADYVEGFFGKEVKGVRNEAELVSRLSTAMIARRLDDVELELPPLVQKTVAVELTGEQRKAYDRMLDEFVAWIEGQEEQVFAANWLSQVLRLKQIAGSLGIFYPDLEQSAKLDALEDLLEEAPAAEKFVVMSQFRTMVDEATRRLRRLKVPYCEMTGQSCLAWRPDVGWKDAPDRRTLIDWFQRSSSPRVFIATTQTGGEGITLTAARYFVFLDLLWTPADNEQAMKRVHRIGQERKVVVYRILAKDTVDFSAILPTLRSKEAIVKAVMGRR